MKKMVLSILVGNTFGVLSRVSGLFSRRGYNIDSLTVGATENREFARMTVVASGDEQILEQIKKQLAKLEDVKEIKILKAGESVCRELVFVKVAVTPEERQSVIAIAGIFRANIVDVCTNSLVIELTGNEAKLTAFIKLLEGYTIKEIARTGITGLSRGDAGEHAGDTGEYSEYSDD